MSATPAPPVRNRIFINYRREDSEAAVGRLAADLRRIFEADQVFQDVGSIVPGAKFAVALRYALETSAAVLVVVGPGWLSATDAQGRRLLDLADDWVRREVAESLKADDVRVFPVLVGNNTTIPAADELPEDLRSLTELQAFSLTTRHWPKDVDELVGILKRVPGLGSAPAGVPAPGPVSAPPRGGSDMENRAPGVNHGSIASGGTALSKLPRTWMPYAAAAAAALAAVVLYVSSGRDRTPVVVPAADPVAPRPAKVVTPAPVAPPSAIVATAQPVFKPGEAFRDCDSCSEMVVIPAGSFTMGSADNEKGRYTDEGPQHRVTISHAFAAGRYEVTFAEWDACVSAGGCAHRPDDSKWTRDRQPAINVDWEDARAYAAWLSKKSGNGYRLLSEAEWEYAARGGTTTRYPWSDEAGTNQANFRESGSRWSGKQTAPVGSFPANRFGLYDMSGNVWEWTQDCWNENYAGAPVDGKAWETGDCLRRVVRGGSWGGRPDVARVANRGREVPALRSGSVGFRVARTL